MRGTYEIITSEGEVLTTMLERGLGRLWSADDAKRLNQRVDEQVFALGPKAVSLFQEYFLHVLIIDEESEFEAAFERAIYEDLAYLRSNGSLGQQEDNLIVDEVLRLLDKFVGVRTPMIHAMSFQDDDDAHADDYDDDDDEDEELMAELFETSSSCGAEDQICVICQDGLYQENGTITSIACRHEFHPKCIARWLRQSQDCPLCKAFAFYRLSPK